MFNDYFINITNILNLKPSKSKSKFKSLSDLLKPYKDNFMVLKMKEKYKIKNKF